MSINTDWINWLRTLIHQKSILKNLSRYPVVLINVHIQYVIFRACEIVRFAPESDHLWSENRNNNFIWHLSKALIFRKEQDSCFMDLSKRQSCRTSRLNLIVFPESLYVALLSCHTFVLDRFSSVILHLIYKYFISCILLQHATVRIRTQKISVFHRDI